MAPYAHSCPTCIGLPRLNERPFFERKSFLAALEQPKAQTQQPQDSKKTEPDNAHKKTQP